MNSRIIVFLIPFLMPGAVLHDGFAKVRSDIVIIQDADFEYDPADFPELLPPILNLTDIEACCKVFNEGRCEAFKT